MAIIVSNSVTTNELMFIQNFLRKREGDLPTFTDGLTTSAAACPMLGLVLRKPELPLLLPDVCRFMGACPVDLLNLNLPRHPNNVLLALPCVDKERLLRLLQRQVMSSNPSAGREGEEAIPALLHLWSLALRNKLDLKRRQ